MLLAAAAHGYYEEYQHQNLYAGLLIAALAQHGVHADVDVLAVFENEGGCRRRQIYR